MLCRLRINPDFEKEIQLYLNQLLQTENRQQLSKQAIQYVPENCTESIAKVILDEFAAHKEAQLLQ